MKKLFILSIVFTLLIFGGCTQQPPEKKLTKWEYTIESIPDVEFTKKINELGAQGWELTFARRAMSDGSGIYEIIFKRPIIEDKK
jgi:hypothetical protein